jgi:hypothetical protein
MNIEKYEHHQGVVSVRSDLKGKHRDHCLCYHCEKFKPQGRQTSVWSPRRSTAIAPSSIL